MQETNDALNQKSSAFITNLDHSIGRIEQYVTYVHNRLGGRWLGEAQVASEPTTLTTVTTEEGSTHTRLGEYDYQVSPLRVVRRDQAGHTSLLSVIQPIITNFEHQTQAAVTKTIEYANRTFRDKQTQAERAITMIEGYYTRRFRSVEQEAERARREAGLWGERYDTTLRRHNSQRDRMNSALDRSQRALNNGEIAAMNAADDEYERLSDEVRRLWQ